MSDTSTARGFEMPREVNVIDQERLARDISTPAPEQYAPPEKRRQIQTASNVSKLQQGNALDAIKRDICRLTYRELVTMAHGIENLLKAANSSQAEAIALWAEGGGEKNSESSG